MRARVLAVLLFLCLAEAFHFRNPFRRKRKEDLLVYGKELSKESKERATSPSHTPIIIDSRALPTQLRSHKFKPSHRNLADDQHVEWRCVTGGCLPMNSEAIATGDLLKNELEDVAIELLIHVYTESCGVSEWQFPRIQAPADEATTANDIIPEGSVISSAKPTESISAEYGRVLTSSHAKIIDDFQPMIDETDSLQPTCCVEEINVANSTVVIVEDEIIVEDSTNNKPEVFTSDQYSGLSVQFKETQISTASQDSFVTAEQAPLSITTTAPPLVETVSTVASINSNTMENMVYLVIFSFMLGIMSTTAFSSAVAFYEKWSKDHIPRYIAHLEQQSIQLLQAEKFEQVCTLLARELRVIEEYRGESHVDTAAFRHFKAKALLALNQYSAAEALLRKVAQCYEDYGEDLYMAHVLEDLGIALQHQCKETAALKCFRHALRIYIEEADVTLAVTGVAPLQRELYGNSSCSGTPDDDSIVCSPFSSPADSELTPSRAHSPFTVRRTSPWMISPSPKIKCSKGIRPRSETNSSGTLTHSYIDRVLAMRSTDSDGTASPSEYLSPYPYPPTCLSPPTSHVQQLRNNDLAVAELGCNSSVQPSVDLAKCCSTEKELLPLSGDDGDLRQALDDLEKLLMEPSLTPASLLYNQKTQYSQYATNEHTAAEGSRDFPQELLCTPIKEGNLPDSILPDAAWIPLDLGLGELPPCPHVARVLQRIADFQSALGHNCEALKYMQAAYRVHCTISGPSCSQTVAISTEVTKLKNSLTPTSAVVPVVLESSTTVTGTYSQPKLNDLRQGNVKTLH